MYKIILMFFAVITLIACSKKNTISNNGFVDIYPQIAGKWKAIKYEEKTTTGGGLGTPGRDTLIVNNNINDKGVPFINYDSVNMIDFINRDSFGIKEADPHPWEIKLTNNINSIYYIDWYRNQIIYFTSSPYNFIFKIIFNNNNSIQIGNDNDAPYYEWTYFERAK